jgi:UbiD family decarboxylase
MNHIKDLRDFLEALKKVGDLQEIQQEVDWNLEMSGIARRSMDLRAPAPLFKNVKDSPKGFAALGAPGGLSASRKYRYARITLALGLPADAKPDQVVKALADARARKLVRPKLLKTGPCKENIKRGAEVDLLQFPVPFIHQHDGGRFFQTYGVNIVKTPDESWTNMSVNRMMLLDKNRLSCLIPPNQHFGIIHAKWKALGKPTPIAIAFGVEPGLPFVGGMPIPENMDEADFMGAYFNEPMEMVKAETVDIDVPASAEIIVEGFVSNTETAMEGPMDEYPGYVGVGGSPKPVLNVTAVTYRNNPIFPFSTAGIPVDENHTGWGIPHSAEVLHLLRNAGLPVEMAWMVLESACHLMVVAVSKDWHEKTKVSSAALCEKVGQIVFSSKAGFGIPKILLVENDFDVTNLDEVVWAFASRAHPSHGEVYFKDEAYNILPVFLDPNEKMTFKVTKVIHNALLADRFKPSERPLRSDLENAWPASVREKVLDNWRSYGFKEQS